MRNWKTPDHSFAHLPNSCHCYWPDGQQNKSSPFVYISIEKLRMVVDYSKSTMTSDMYQKHVFNVGGILSCLPTCSTPQHMFFPPGIQCFFVGSMRRKPNKTDKLLLPQNGFGDHWGLIRASHSSQWSFYPHVCQPLQVGCSQPFRNCFKHHTKKNCNEPAYQAIYYNLPKSFPSWTRHIRRDHPWRCDAPTQWEPWEPWLQWSQRSQPETAETHR